MLDSIVENTVVDVLIVVALQDELDAVAEGGGADGWRALRDHVYFRKLPNATGQELGVAVAWTGGMGAMATAKRAAPLVKEFQPSCLAMCGICAGKRGEVALGDVIVADSLYSFDHGKLKAAKGKKDLSRFFHEIKTYDLNESWRMDATAFRRDLGWAKPLLPSRPPTRTLQIEWLIRTLYAHERKAGPAPHKHRKYTRMFRTEVPEATDWSDRLRELRKKKWLAPGRGVLKLTKGGRKQAKEYMLNNSKGAPRDPAFRVHVGPIATGNQVIEDPKIFSRLALVQRKTLGVEMEAVAIGAVGDELPKRAIVAKAVSDFADHDKDDRFREFACRASAAWLLAFLRKQLSPKPASAQTPSAPVPVDPGPPSPFPVLVPGPTVSRRLAPDLDQPGTPRGILLSDETLPSIGDLHRRVERALALRFPDARATWKQGPEDVPPPLRSLLEVQVPGGHFTTLHVVAVIEGDLSVPVLEAYVARIVKRYGTHLHYVAPSMVYTGAVTSAIQDRAAKSRVRLESLLELQGLLDFRTYVDHQTRGLEGDPIYPSGIFVPQRLLHRARHRAPSRPSFILDDEMRDARRVPQWVRWGQWPGASCQEKSRISGV